MPTRTFINLPKEKRIRILKAAKKEFSRVPLDKAVIATIVKDAQIPRGSFYQYFESIDDLFVYLLNYMYGIDRKKFLRNLQDCNNDFYEALKLNFANSIDRLSIEENRMFRLNTFATLFNCESEQKEKIINIISKSDFPVELEFCPEELQGANKQKLLDIIKMINKSCTESYLSNASSIDEAKSSYNKYIDIVRLGFSNI